MKVLNVSEVLNGIDQSIKKKESEKKQLQAIRDAMYNVIGLDDALKGEGGTAIKEYFKVLHIPVLLLFIQFLDQYIQSLKDIKKNLEDYETEDGMVREEFITSDVKNGLDKALHLTHDSIDAINAQFSKVSDLVGGGPISTTAFDLHMHDAKSLIHKTTHDLNATDHKNTSALSDPVHDLKSVQQLIGKIQGWSKNGVFLDPEKVSEVQDYFGKTDIVKDMLEDAMDISIKQKDGTATKDMAKWLNMLTHSDTLDSEFFTLSDINWAGMLKSLGVVGLAHYSGFLRIQYSKKGNHYIFKYNRKVAHVLKGKKGPKWLRLRIQEFNRKQRKLRQKGKAIIANDNYGKGKKTMGKIMAKQRPLHEQVKGRVYGKTGNSLVIEKAKFPKLFAKGSGLATAGLSALDAYGNIRERMETNKEYYSGEKLDEMNARAIGEEVNTAAGKAIGATAGGYIGATIGSIGGPLGAVAGGIIGSYVGEAVGGWAAKYTKEWASNTAAWVEDQADKVTEIAKNTLDEAKEVVDDVTDKINGVADKLFGWI